LFSLFAADPYELMPDTPFPDAPLPPLHNDVHLLHKDNAPAVKWMIGKEDHVPMFVSSAFVHVILVVHVGMHVGLSCWPFILAFQF
jgi:hypothetical protein